MSLRGFLKKKCSDEDGVTYYQCENHQGRYKVRYESEDQPFDCDGGRGRMLFDDICSNDPWFYQVCGHQLCPDQLRLVSTGSGSLCGDFVCDLKRQESNSYWHQFNNDHLRCNQEFECLNTKIDEEKCVKALLFDCRLHHPFRMEKVPYKTLCDDKCDCSNCADEAGVDLDQCQNKTLVGLFCKKTFSNKLENGTLVSHIRRVYIKPGMICDYQKHCDSGEDERYCNSMNKLCDYHTQISIQNKFVWKRRERKYSSKYNVKCSVPNPKNKAMVCIDFKDQLNCPDDSEVALECWSRAHNGMNETIRISKNMVNCKVRSKLPEWVQSLGIDSQEPLYPLDHLGRLKPLCNDSIDDKCFDLDHDCLLHKHELCDGKHDCRSTNNDETNDICRDMEDAICVRRVGGLERKIPSQWVEDGVMDCEDGLDENKEYWVGIRNKYKTCGDENDWSSFKSSDCTQEKFYFCSNNTKEMISFDRLCDRIPSCGSEERVCSVARNQDIFLTKATAGLVTERQKSGLSFCLPGVENVAYFSGGCTQVNITGAHEGDQVFGVKEKTVWFPNSTFDCRYLYGSLLSLVACKDMCDEASHTPCKLSKIRHDSCTNIEVRQGMAYTLAVPEIGDPYLTMVKKEGKFFTHLSMFECPSGICIDFDKVCNLANDCGDWSDEDGCKNQFLCGTKDERIPWNRYCDGVYDCSDYSDECGNDCKRTREIINGTFQVIFAWIAGLMASLLNLVAIFASLYQIFKESSLVKVVNLALIALIGIGDLCVGLYLVSVSVIDHKYRRAELTFCQDYFRWLTSDTCSALGVLNTFGSQLSLYSMTVLSVFRVFCVKSSSLRGNISWKGKMATTLVCFCLIISAAVVSFTPLFPPLDDYFVNGLAYFENPMLIGSHDKKKHISILKEHYGKFNAHTLSWKQIMKMVSNMFSTFHGGTVGGSKVNFYGNSGVCLFKFFVRDDDPQKLFTWFVIVKNAVCFIVITISYVLIHTIVAASERKLTQNGASDKAPVKKSRNSALNRKITLMVLTDFLCWIPFIVFCSLHYFEVLDATKLYSLFSIVILPLNSVINPLLYDNSGILDFLFEKCRKVYRKVRIRNRTSDRSSRGQGCSSELGGRKTPQDNTLHESVKLENIGEIPEDTIQEHPEGNL